MVEADARTEFADDAADEDDAAAVADTADAVEDDFVAYTTYDLPSAGLSIVSSARVMSGAFMMSHSSNFLYGFTSG